MTMGERIKDLRLKNNLTQEELGKSIGVQKSAIRKYEKGDVENIKRTSILKMATIFNVSPSYLMGWDDEVPAATTGNEDTPVTKEFMNILNSVDPETQERLLQMVHLFLDSQDKNK